MGAAEQVLDNLNPFDLFDAEADRLDSFFRTLDDAAWTRPSHCAGWSVRDVLAHLAGEEMYNHACLDGNIAGFFKRLEREGVGGAGDYGAFNEWCVEQRRSQPVEQLLTEWRSSNRSTRQRMRALGRDGLLETSVGPYPAGLQAFHYASEYATHADDVDAPVASDEMPGRMRWRALVGRFVLWEQQRPVRVTELPDRYRVRQGDVTADLSEPDFVAATVARLPGDHPLQADLREALACLA